MSTNGDALRLAQAGRIMRTTLDRVRERLTELVDQAAAQSGEVLDWRERAERVEALYRAHLHGAGNAPRHLTDAQLVALEQGAIDRASKRLKDGDVHGALSELRFFAQHYPERDRLDDVARDLTAERFS